MKWVKINSTELVKDKGNIALLQQFPAHLSTWIIFGLMMNVIRNRTNLVRNIWQQITHCLLHVHVWLSMIRQQQLYYIPCIPWIKNTHSEKTYIQCYSESEFEKVHVDVLHKMKVVDSLSLKKEHLFLKTDNIGKLADYSWWYICKV